MRTLAEIDAEIASVREARSATLRGEEVDVRTPGTGTRIRRPSLESLSVLLRELERERSAASGARIDRTVADVGRG